jgi:hypothetical protein
MKVWTKSVNSVGLKRPKTWEKPNVNLPKTQVLLSLRVDKPGLWNLLKVDKPGLKLSNQVYELKHGLMQVFVDKPNCLQILSKPS